MMFDVFTMLPKIFRTAQLMTELLRGGVTEEEVEQIAAELYELLSSIPALQGLLGFVKIALNIAKVIILALPTSPAVQQLFAQNNISNADVKAAEQVLAVLDKVEGQLLDEGTLIGQKADAMSDKDVLDNI